MTSDDVPERSKGFDDFAVVRITPNPSSPQDVIALAGTRAIIRSGGIDPESRDEFYQLFPMTPGSESLGFFERKDLMLTGEHVRRDDYVSDVHVGISPSGTIVRRTRDEPGGRDR